MRMILPSLAILLLKPTGACKMDYLNRAEDYADAQGDGNWFREWYLTFRSEYNVRASVWYTLVYLYDQNVADQLEQAV